MPHPASLDNHPLRFAAGTADPNATDPCLPNPHAEITGESGGMSAAAIVLIAADDTRLTAVEFRVLANIAKGRTTRASIAAGAKCGESSVPRARRKLQTLGYLRCEFVSGKASEYVVTLPDTGIPVDTGITPDTSTRITNDTPTRIIDTGPAQEASPACTRVEDNPLRVITPRTPTSPSESLFPEQETCTNTHPEKAKKRSRGVRVYSPEFEAFWKAYPAAVRQNSNKQTAADRWDAARKRWDAETIMGAEAHYLRNTKVSDAQPGPWKPRTCHAEVFLNGKLESAIEAMAEAANAPPSEVWSEELRDWVRA